MFSSTYKYVDGYTAINTIPMRVISTGQRDQPLFPGRDRTRPGVSGVAIRDCALETVRGLHGLRTRFGKAELALVGVGGVSQAEHVTELLMGGASVVQMCTACIFDPTVGIEIRKRLAADGYGQPRSRTLGQRASAVTFSDQASATAFDLTVEVAAEMNVPFDSAYRAVQREWLVPYLGTLSDYSTAAAVLPRRGGTRHQKTKLFNGCVVRSISNRRTAEVLWNGPVVKTLERVYGCNSPVSLFIERAKEACAKARISGPPFDPYAYARALDIEVRHVDDMTIDGMLIRDGKGRFVATLKRNASPERRNFTLAHEIAHTFFYNDLEEFGGKFRSGSLFDPEEERLCDLAAAEMLMPFTHFRRDIVSLRDRRRILTPLAILDLANRYKVSVYAAAIRVAWILKNVICAIWTRRSTIDQEWITPTYNKRLTLCRTGYTSIERAFDKTGGVITERDTFYQGGKRIVRTASSFRLSSGKVLSVLQPAGLLGRSTAHSSQDKPQASPPRQYLFNWGLAVNSPPSFRQVSQSPGDRFKGPFWKTPIHRVAVELRAILILTYADYRSERAAASFSGKMEG